MSKIFHLKAPFEAAGDQPQAIEGIVRALKQKDKHHILLGVTGSGKTFTMAKVISELDRSALVIAPNKTLAAQLYLELKNFFPDNAVGFFISFYDYYQPEAYVPSTDTYIAKDSSINQDIDKMRHQATRCLFEEKAAIIVASVSCIYGLGSPDSYGEHVVSVKCKESLERDSFLKALIDIQYSRNDHNLLRGHFRVRGDVVDILPAHQTDEAIRVEFWGEEIDSLSIIDVLSGKVIKSLENISIYPNSHYVTDRKDLKQVIRDILTDLGVKLRELKAQNKLVEYQRLEQRTMQDIETLEELGFCPGIENYSRYLSGKKPGEAPPCLLDYFPKDYITIIDESHITIPQIGGMYRGDRARKQTLVDFGFRLPSALDNRPLKFEEFLERCHQTIYVSATPGKFEKDELKAKVSEQIIRPTGLIDPPIEIKSANIQVDDLIGEMKAAIAKQGRVLITTLTKKMSEELSEYYRDFGFKIKYLHADIEAIERSELLRGLRRGDFDILIGINLLREGLDLPEVVLVAVMDADKEGFLRSHTSLIQIVGRAARNQNAKVIFYANKITDSMRKAMDETDRRRSIQVAYNQTHNITPQTIIKSIPDDLRAIYGLLDQSDASLSSEHDVVQDILKSIKSTAELEKIIKRKTKDMQSFAGQLQFEKAASLRDEIRNLKSALLALAGEVEGA